VFTDRIDKVDDPAVVLASIDPDEDLATGLRLAGHRHEADFGIFEMVQDADRIHDVEGPVGERQLVEIGLDDIDAVAHPLVSGVDRLREVGADDVSGAPGMCVLGEPGKPAAGVQDASTVKGIGLQGEDPIAPLLLCVRIVRRVVRPGVAKGVCRPLLLLRQIRAPDQARDVADHRPLVPGRAQHPALLAPKSVAVERATEDLDKPVCH
jgi:hypothetical protein